jgi:hypothetical protein
MTFVQRIRSRFGGTDDDSTWPDTLTSLRDPAAGVPTIADAPLRVPVRTAGRIHSVRVQPRAGVPTVEATIVDDAGQLTLVFLGRRHVGGIEVGRHLVVEGVIVQQLDQLRMLNPVYRLL